MRVNELQKKIVKAIRTSLSHRDLCSLCSFNDLSVTGLKRSIQDRLESFVQVQSYGQLVLINSKIEELDRSSTTSKRSNTTSSINTTVDSSNSNYRPDTLSDALVSTAPINLQDEIAVINRNEIVVLNFTSYAQPQTAVPTQTVTGINERAHNIRIPNMLPHVPIQSSPFYCCVVCLHPLSLLIPQQMPNINQNNRVNSHNTINFSLSENAQKLISKNVQSNGNKIDYKWQVLLRFVNIDPTLPLPTPDESVSQMIPPYLSLNVNNESVPLWDILPSNCKTKEGKRHPRPVNITDKLNITSHTKNCYRQTVVVNWWQTPSVFQYYYVGVYLERKLSVKEILDLFASNRHVNILPIEATLSLIKTKLNDGRYANEGDDDDLVVSKVLPINLSCPVGRSRIEIPLRTLNCQHLQCFDAHLFLSMNERRSIWKCPICDMSATPNELFCDRYFQKILDEFKDNDNVNDINVSADGSYIPIFHRNDDRVQPESAKVTEECHHDDDMIVLDSDEESDQPHTSHDTARTSNKLSTSTSRWDKQTKSQSETTPKVSANISKSVNVSKSIQINLNNSSSVVITRANEETTQNIHRLRSIPNSVSKTLTTNLQTGSHITVLNCPNSSFFSVPPPLYPSHSIYPSPNVPIISISNTFQSSDKPQMVISSPIQAPLFAPNYNNSSTIHQSQNQKVFQISSIIQSTMPLTMVTASPLPMNKSLQSSILTPSISSFTDVIQAPAHIPIVSTSHVTKTSLIHEPIPAPANIAIPTLVSRSLSSVISAPSSLAGPICAPTIEQIQTQLLSKPIQEPIKTPIIENISAILNMSSASKELIRTPVKALNGHENMPQVTSSVFTNILNQMTSSFTLSSTMSDKQDISKGLTSNIVTTSSITNSSSLNKSYLTIDRSINDVVKTLPTNQVKPVEPPIKNKNIIGRPISCPVIILDEHSLKSLVPEIIPSSTQATVMLNNNSQAEKSVNNAPENPTVVTSSLLKESAANITVTSNSEKETKSTFNDVEKSISNNKTKEVTQTQTSQIAIPELSIDLTSDDDEAVPVTKPNNVQAARQIMTGRDIKWCSLLDQKNRANIMSNGIGSRLPKSINDGKGISQTTVSVNSFAHYKPGAINRLIPKRSAPLQQDKRSIDLTVDDEEEIQTISAAKKSRMGINKELNNLGPI